MVAGAFAASELETSKTEFAEADKQLNVVYLSLKKTMPEWSFKQLQPDQRRWVSYRDAMAERAVFDLEGKVKDVKTKADYWSMMAGLTWARVDVLNGWAAVAEEGKWLGDYSDSYGGGMSISVKEGKLHFKIDVVRGLSHHVGQISGVAEINQSYARFSDEGKGREGVEGKTWLDFEILDGARIKVRGVNTSYYHGARAYFDGTYVRVEHPESEGCSQ